MLVRQPLHADEDAAAVARAAGPFLNIVINRPPAQKIEVPDAVGDAHRLRQSRPEVLLDGIHLPGRHEPEMSLEAAVSEARRGLV